MANTLQNKTMMAHAAAIATSIAAIATAYASYTKENPERKATASYELLAKEVQRLDSEQKKLHEDDVAMKNYLDGYLKSVRDSQIKTNETVQDVATTPRMPRITVKPPAPPTPALPEPTAKPSPAQLPPASAL